MTELLKLTQENNRILEKVYRKQKMAIVYKAIYWFIILSVTFGGFYFIQPYLGSVLNYYGAVSAESGSGSLLKSGNGLPDVSRIQDILKQINGE